MFNIFQGSEPIRKVFVETLGHDLNYECNRFGSLESIYFSSYFYLTKRFGLPENPDEYKLAGVWKFKVKSYIIMLELDSYSLKAMVFGKMRLPDSPYMVKLRRERWRKTELLFFQPHPWEEKWKNRELSEKIMNQYLEDKGISYTDFIADREALQGFFKYTDDYNNKILNVDYEEIEKLYGDAYLNSYGRHALKTLEKFLKNMLNPISVRDCYYNINGRISNQQAGYFRRYENNIKFELINSEQKNETQTLD